MKRKLAVIIAIATIFFLSQQAFADTHAAADEGDGTCASANVQAAINKAADGDTVTVPAGSCTWTTQVSITNKAITVQGAGIDSTIITANITTGTRPGVFKVTTKPATIKGFTFNGTAPTYGGHIVMESTGDETALFRITGNKFTVNSGYAIFTFGLAYGLIDGNTFITTIDHTFMEIQADGATSWTRAASLGDNKVVIIENNTFSNSAATGHYRPVFGQGGARFVFRYNDVTNMALDIHGKCGTYGTRTFEWYNNAFTLEAGKSQARWMQVKGGTGVVYNNTLTRAGTITGNAIALSESRLNDTGSCSGVHQTCCSGYPCSEQIGRGLQSAGIGDGEDNTEATDPLYFWANTINGVVTNPTVEAINSGTCDPVPDVADYIQASRDYYASASTPKAGYTAYTCPHPLADPGATGYCNASVAGTAAYNLEAGGDPVPYAVTPSVASGSGTISPAVAEAVASGGDSSTYTATPENGWKISSWGGTCGLTGSASTAQKTNVTEDCTITVTFTEIKLMPW